MTGPEGQATAGRVLASSAERELVIQVLKDAFVQGRLTRDEFGARAGGALGARTRAELAALTADLPGDPPAADRPSLLERRPVLWAVSGSGSCVTIAVVLVFLAAHVFDVDGLGTSFQPWSGLCDLMAFVTLITGLGVFIHGLSIADGQRRARIADERR